MLDLLIKLILFDSLTTVAIISENIKKIRAKFGFTKDDLAKIDSGVVNKLGDTLVHTHTLGVQS